jgi:tetratricopeptide (TPR) repeat protein
MIRISRLAAAAGALAAVGAFALPASAQYANEYTPPKLLHQGTTSKAIAGTGTVIVQVQVNANGSHKALKVIHSTNAGDNAAAIDLAQHSTYRPAHRGKTPITAFYDFTLKFTGKAVAAQNAGTAAAGSGVTAQIDRMIRAGNYAGAKAKAEQELASNPNDAVLNSELGAANYFLADYPAAAQAFSKVPNVAHEFAQVAANSFVQAAQKLVSSNPTQAVQYAQKAVAMSPNSGGAYYSLGAAQLAAGDAAQAVTNLKKARELVFADPKADVKSRVNVDAELFSAQTKAGDTAGAATTMAEIKRLDPNNPAVGNIMANNLLTQGQAAQKAGNFTDAIADYEKAASSGSTQAQVTGYTLAAFAQSEMLQKQKNTPTVADYAKMKSYADKALAANPNDAQANFAQGVALGGEYIVGGKTDASLKSQALAALNKAKSEAQAAGNMSLSLSIDNFIKQQLP